MSFDLYVWHSPRDLDADAADALLVAWHEAGADPAESPFEPSTDVGWFHRELRKDLPGLETSSDALPSQSRTPIWLSADDEPPARLVAIRLPPIPRGDVLENIFGLATKYDLVLFDSRNRRLHFPLEELSAYASATFWPGGAIQAAVAGGAGGVIALAAWIVGIPVISGIVALAGGFMFAMAVVTFVHEGRKALRSRGSDRERP